MLLVLWKFCAIWDGSESEGAKQDEDAKDGAATMFSRVESLTINEDVKENEPEDDEGLPIYPYDRLKITAADPVTEIDVTRREVIVWPHTILLLLKEGNTHVIF